MKTAFVILIRATALVILLYAAAKAFEKGMVKADIEYIFIGCAFIVAAAKVNLPKRPLD